MYNCVIVGATFKHVILHAYHILIVSTTSTSGFQETMETEPTNLDSEQITAAHRHS